MGKNIFLTFYELILIHIMTLKIFKRQQCRQLEVHKLNGTLPVRELVGYNAFKGTFDCFNHVKFLNYENPYEKD